MVSNLNKLSSGIASANGNMLGGNSGPPLRQMGISRKRSRDEPLVHTMKN
jgi:hypothetical protein